MCDPWPAMVQGSSSPSLEFVGLARRLSSGIWRARTNQFRIPISCNKWSKLMATWWTLLTKDYDHECTQTQDELVHLILNRPKKATCVCTVRDCASQQDRMYCTKYCIALNAGGMPVQYCTSGPDCPWILGYFIVSYRSPCSSSLVWTLLCIRCLTLN